MPTHDSSSSRSSNAASGRPPTREETGTYADPRRDPTVVLNGGGGMLSEAFPSGEFRRSPRRAGSVHGSSLKTMKDTGEKTRTDVSVSGAPNTAYSSVTGSPTALDPYARAEGKEHVSPVKYNSPGEHSLVAGQSASGRTVSGLGRDHSPGTGVKRGSSTTGLEGRGLIRAHSSNDLLRRRPAAGEVFEPGGWMGEGPPPTQPAKKPITSSSSAMGLPLNSRISATSSGASKTASPRGPLSSPTSSSGAVSGGAVGIGLPLGTVAGRGQVRLLPSSGESGCVASLLPGAIHGASPTTNTTAGFPTVNPMNGSNNVSHMPHGIMNAEAHPSLGKYPLNSNQHPSHSTAPHGGVVPGGPSPFLVTLTSTGTPSSTSLSTPSTTSSSRIPRPEWLNAAQRVKVGVDGNTGGAAVSTGRSRIESVLPPEQNATYGLQRHSGRGITEVQLRDFAEQQGKGMVVPHGVGGPGSMDPYGGHYGTTNLRRTASAHGLTARGISGSPGRVSSHNKVVSPVENGNSGMFSSSNVSGSGNLPARLVMEEVAYSAKQQQFQPSPFPAHTHGTGSDVSGKKPNSVFSPNTDGKMEGGLGPHRRMFPTTLSNRGGGNHISATATTAGVTDMGSGLLGVNFPLPYFAENGTGGGGVGNGLPPGVGKQSPLRHSQVSQMPLEKSNTGLYPYYYPVPSTSFGQRSEPLANGLNGGVSAGGATETAWWNMAYDAADAGKGSSISMSKTSLSSVSAEKSSSLVMQPNGKSMNATTMSTNGGNSSSMEGGGWGGVGGFGNGKRKGAEGNNGGVGNDFGTNFSPAWMMGANAITAVGPGNRLYTSPTSTGPDTVQVEFGPSGPLPATGNGFCFQTKGVTPQTSGGQNWMKASKQGRSSTTGARSIYDLPSDGGVKGLKSSASSSGHNEQGGVGTLGVGVQNSTGSARQRNGAAESAYSVEESSPPSSPLARHEGKKKKEDKEKRRKNTEMENKAAKYTSPADREERNLQARDFNALHAIPWEQREQMPMSGFGTRFFALLATPRFWEKMDWTFRGSLLTVVPTMILSLNPGTKELIPIPSSFAFMAFWVTMPTFGSGLRESIMLCKGFVFSGILLLILIGGIRPGSPWLSLLFLFLFTVFFSFVGDAFKKNTAYLFTSTLMEYINSPSNGFTYMLKSYATTAVSLCFGIAGFLIPFIRWSSENARHYTHVWGNSLSIAVQGTCSSFWVEKPIERELNLSHLRQLRATADMCAKKVSVALEESEYEPHTGSYIAKMRTRYEFCQRFSNILASMQHLLELLTDNPSRIDTPMCHSFGSLLQDDLALIASAMDCMVLKIVDFNRLVTKNELLFFREAHQRFQDAVTSVREDVILNNENYETELADVYLGYFLFSVDALCSTIASFHDVENPQSNFLHSAQFIFRDADAVWKHTKQLFFELLHERRISRRAKEAIKLGLCMTLPGIFQIYVLDNESTSPLAGASVIALLYHPTGAESFHYASNRLLGTVMGSLLSLIAVELANGRLLVLYIFIIIFSFAGAYVQAAPGFYALGNAIVCSTISIMTQYDDNSAAMDRITQNCFAILVYFAIVSILWPMRAHTKVKMSLDTALRCIRESCTSLLRNLDMPEDAAEVSADVSALLTELQKKIASQQKFIPGAVEEPTLGSVEFPETQWWKIVDAERNLLSALNMMRTAYRIFMSQRADAETAISVHWVVLHRIAPFASDLADLIHAMMDLHLLQVQRTSIVPIAHLTRLRLAMQEAHKAIIDTYIATLQRKVHGDDEIEEEEWNNSIEIYSTPRIPHGTDSSSYGTPSPLSQLLPRRSPSPTHNIEEWEKGKEGGGDDDNAEGTLAITTAPTSPAHRKPAPLSAPDPSTSLDLTDKHRTNPPLLSPTKGGKKDGISRLSALDFTNTERFTGKNAAPSPYGSPLAKASLKRRGSGPKDDHEAAADLQSVGERSSIHSHDDGEDDFGVTAASRRRRGGGSANGAGARDMTDPSKNITSRSPAKGRETGKKGAGYLTYKLTPQEEEVLRSFLQARRNAGDGSGGEGGNGTASSSPSAINLACTPSNSTMAMSDMRMLAASVDDQSLAEKLRKKHKIKVQRKENEMLAADETVKIVAPLSATPLVDGDVDEEEKGGEKEAGKGEKKTKLLLFKSKKGMMPRSSRKKDEGEKSIGDGEDMGEGEEEYEQVEEYEADAEEEEGCIISPSVEEDHDEDNGEEGTTGKQASGRIEMSNASFISARPFLSRLFKNSKNIKYKNDELSSIVLDHKRESGPHGLPPLSCSTFTVEDESEGKILKASFSKVKEVSHSFKDPGTEKSLTTTELQGDPMEGGGGEDDNEEEGESCEKRQGKAKMNRTAEEETLGRQRSLLLINEGQEAAKTGNGTRWNNTNHFLSPSDFVCSSLSRSPSAFTQDVEGGEDLFKDEEEKKKHSGKKKLQLGTSIYSTATESPPQSMHDMLGVTPSSSNLGTVFTKTVAAVDSAGTASPKNAKRSGSNNTSATKTTAKDSGTATSPSAVQSKQGGKESQPPIPLPPAETKKLSPELVYSTSDPNTIPLVPGTSNRHSRSNMTSDLGKTFSTPEKGNESIFEHETETMRSEDVNSNFPVEDELDELTFFDGARGEFVLTNSDIHSLEAFFFGTRALVVYLHDLQRAIIDMHHQYELNKKL